MSKWEEKEPEEGEEPPPKLAEFIHIQEVNNFLTNNTTNRIPAHLTLNKESLTAVVQQKPARDSLQLSINELLVVEFYSR